MKINMKKINQSFGDVDYTGVSTDELAKILEHTGLGVQEISRRTEVNPRVISKVLTREYPFTSLGLADRLLIGLDFNVSKVLRVIPKEGEVAAAKMALDEMEVQGIPVNEDLLMMRAGLLEKLRALVIR